MKYKILVIVVFLIFSCLKKDETLKFNNYYSEAEKFYKQNEFSKALKFYLKSKMFMPEEKKGEIFYKIGFCYDKGEKNIKKAKKYYQLSLKYLNIDTIETARFISAAYFNLGIIFHKEKNFEKKYDCFASAYSILSKLEQMGKVEAEDLFRLGYYYMDNKNFELAINYFNKAAERFKKENPSHFYYAGSYFNIGKIYWDTKEVEKASYFWKKAIEIEPQNEYYREWYEKSLIANP